jgi:biotin operon repressor
MGERPTGLTLDRIENQKGYELSNCRWATPKEQARQNRRLAWFAGTPMSRREIATQLGISPTLLNYRINAGHIVLEDC